MGIDALWIALMVIDALWNASMIIDALWIASMVIDGEQAPLVHFFKKEIAVNLIMSPSNKSCLQGQTGM